ncbi:uncharacterized protein KY384_004418 [Bacidia gigantensis]|uniref:uncharacterized protein n=1 Tax=Bacidia gigantensis TaxID=2732470 RepID=UPI001D050E9E|nr:uncharacterized protein KY384_004418 [Bacidia gigantensis]KAG8531061.1 hypothetical protein KY384_004418 [Bacidia gigantensis]
MAHQNPAFPSRYGASNLGKLPDRSVQPFGTSTQQQTRETARQEREREKQEQERREREQMENLSEEQREEIREAVRPTLAPLCASVKAFNLFDLDKDGHIDYHELKVACKALGFDLPKPELLEILRNHGIEQPTPQSQQFADSNRNLPAPIPKRLLPFVQFQNILMTKILARDPREEILRAFELFDEGQKGKISLDDLRRVARELGEGLEEEELTAMIDEFDMDGDGAISREEFMGICLS